MGQWFEGIFSTVTPFRTKGVYIGVIFCVVKYGNYKIHICNFLLRKKLRPIYDVPTEQGNNTTLRVV